MQIHSVFGGPIIKLTSTFGKDRIPIILPAFFIIVNNVIVIIISTFGWENYSHVLSVI